MSDKQVIFEDDNHGKIGKIRYSEYSKQFVVSIWDPDKGKNYIWVPSEDTSKLKHFFENVEIKKNTE